MPYGLVLRDRVRRIGSCLRRPHRVEHLVPVHTSYTNTCVQGHPKTNTWTWTQSHAQYPHLTDLPVVFVHLFNFIICERTKTSRKPLSVLGPAGQSRRFLFLRRTIDTETNSSTFTSVCVMLVCVGMCVNVFLCVYVYVFVCLCVFVSCPCHLLCHQAGAGGWSTSASQPQMTTQPCSFSPSCTTAVLPLDLSSTYKQLWAEKQAHKDLLFWRPDTVVALLTLVPLQCCCSSESKNGYIVNSVGAKLEHQRRYKESLLIFPVFLLMSSLTLNLVHNIFL